MTKKEFLRGWALLVIQPWGRAYNHLVGPGVPSCDATMQFDLYYTGLQWAQAEAWEKVARQSAAGSKWPSLGELVVALRVVNQAYVPALQDQRQAMYCECPADVRAMLDKLQCRKSFSFPADQKEAV